MVYKHTPLQTYITSVVDVAIDEPSLPARSRIDAARVLYDYAKPSYTSVDFSASTTDLIDVANVPKCNIIDGKFVPTNITNEINSYITHPNPVAKVNHTFVFSSNRLIRKITVDFFIFDPVTNSPKKFVREIVSLFPLIQCVLGSSELSNTETSPLSVYLFMSEKTKHFPSVGVGGVKSELGKDNCNSAIAYTCDTSNQILVYRLEEWKKTLVHELFHNQCIDTTSTGDNTMDAIITDLFHLPGKPSFRETYCEFWATVLICVNNAMKLSIDPITGNVDRQLFTESFLLMIDTERSHSLFQFTKIIRYWGIEWCDFLKYSKCIDRPIDRQKIPIPKEQTNVFCYYLLKTHLLFDIGKTVVFMKANNPVLLARGNGSFWDQDMGSIIRSVAYSDEFETDVQHHDRIFQIIRTRYTNTNSSDNCSILYFFDTNMRMTVTSSL